jgi:hypothetical protein
MTGEINNTLAEIPDNEERVLWVIFHVLITLSTLLGEILILLGTLRYKAIKLHGVIVVIIQHLAVSDLTMTVFRVIPNILSLTTGRWVLGTFLCHLNLNLTFITTSTTAMLTCVLSTCKLLIVQYPLRTRTWSRKRAHTVCALVWLVSALQPHQIIHMFFTTSKSLYFDHTYYFCNVAISLTQTPVWFVWFAYSVSYLAFLVMFLLLLTTSALLLHAARESALRHGESVKWQGILTVILTVVVFLTSYLPSFTVSLLVRLSSTLNPSSVVKRGMLFMESVNVTANFFVYTLTLGSFREFLSGRIHYLARQLGWSSHTAQTLRQIQRQPQPRQLISDSNV